MLGYTYKNKWWGHKCNVITECIDIHNVAKFWTLLELENVQKVTHIQAVLYYNINIHPIVYIIYKRGAYFERI